MVWDNYLENIQLPLANKPSTFWSVVPYNTSRIPGILQYHDIQIQPTSTNSECY